MKCCSRPVITAVVLGAVLACGQARGEGPVVAMAFDKATGAHAFAIRDNEKTAKKDALAACVELGGKKANIVSVISERGRFAIAVGRDQNNVAQYAIVSGEANAKVAGEKAKAECRKKGVKDPQVTVDRIE